jgi:methylated-DNA-[protein]-cysteine S-methyltransferase
LLSGSRSLDAPAEGPVPSKTHQSEVQYDPEGRSIVRLLTDRVDSPLGTILLAADGTHLCALDFGDCETRMTARLEDRYGRFHLARVRDPLGVSSRIRAYLAGDYGALDDIPVSAGGTEWEQRVWSALRSIQVGTVVSYGELARRLGCPRSTRAVGAANARNPVAIVVPCHRLIGAGARLTGYAGGLDRKRWLLQHEGIVLPERDRVQDARKGRSAPRRPG